MHDLLKAERECLAEGRLDELQTLTERHARTLDRLLAAPPPPEADLAKLRQEAEANARLIQAAREGLESARRRLRDIEQQISGWQSYDRQGQRTSVSASRSTLERKA